MFCEESANRKIMRIVIGISGIVQIDIHPASNKVTPISSLYLLTSLDENFSGSFFIFDSHFHN
jgi:hypothetical protein